MVLCVCLGRQDRSLIEGHGACTGQGVNTHTHTQIHTEWGGGIWTKRCFVSPGASVVSNIKGESSQRDSAVLRYQ